jgi:imidazolonepropionase-like amidohydrolase
MESYDGIPENAAFVDAAGGCAMMHSDLRVRQVHLNTAMARAMAAGLHAGLKITREQAIRWVTSNAAKALGLEDRIGSLEVGKNADVVIWSADPFSVYAKVDQVFIDGALAFDRADPKYQPRSDFELGQPAQGPAR